MSYDYDSDLHRDLHRAMMTTLCWCPPEDGNFKAALQSAIKADLLSALRHRDARGHKTGVKAIRAEINRREKGGQP